MGNLMSMLMRKARSASEFGVSTDQWHTDIYEEPPEGYLKVLSQGISFVDVVAGSTAATLLAKAPVDSQPRYCVRVSPRPTFGFGIVLNKALVHHWTVLGPLQQTMGQLKADFVETLTLHSDGQGVLKFPFWVYDAAAEAYKKGLCNKVGVSHPNATPGSVRRVAEELRRRGADLSCIHVELSLLNRRALSLIPEVRTLGIQVYATTALGRDELASGRYTAVNPTGGEIDVPRFTLAQLIPLRPLHEALASVAARARQRLEKSVDSTQVALQWVRSKGASPLCDVSSDANAKALAGCEGWSLTEDEVQQLDKAADEVDKSRPRGYRP